MVGVRQLPAVGDRQGDLLTPPGLDEPFEQPVRRVVRPVFGSVASIGIVGEVPGAGIEGCFARLEEIEARFSPYRADSEISRIRDGGLAITDAHPEVREILGACEALRDETDGVFDAWRASVDGRLDPSGYVKGWAIGEAAAILRASGATNAAIGIGGDIAAWGGGAAGIGWSVGVVDPAKPDQMMARVALRDAAIATSGLTERPEHLRDARTGGVAVSPWASFTVVGPSIARADALATIGFLEGRPGLDRVDREPGYGALAAGRDGILLATEWFRRITI